MSEFQFKTGCSLNKGPYCNATMTFWEKSEADAERKARDWVAKLAEKDKRIEELRAIVCRWEDDCTELRTEAELQARNADIKDLQASIDETVKMARCWAKIDQRSNVSWCLNKIIKSLTGKTEKGADDAT